MDRRDFLARFAKGALATGASAGLVAAAAHAKSKHALVSGAEHLQAQIKSVSARMDNVEESHRRVLKILIVVASASTGFDALTLLKGDIFS